jgi:hypothetical protein
MMIAGLVFIYYIDNQLISGVKSKRERIFNEDKIRKNKEKQIIRLE